MATPTKKEIENEALRIFMQDQERKGFSGLADNKPEISELKEEGCFDKAKENLKSNSAKDYKKEWNAYRESFGEKVLNDDVSIQRDFPLNQLIADMKAHLGYVISGESGHGKSYLGFSLIRETMKPENKTRVIVFTPSTIYSRRFGGGINLVKVGTADFSPILDREKAELDRIDHARDSFFVNLDKKYAFDKTEFLDKLLNNDHINLIFEIHYLNSRKIKTFITECLKVVYERQKQKLIDNPDYDKHILFVLEEAQNSYATYNLNDDASLEALTILSQGRTDANCHFLAICQRLAEVSVKVTERLRLISGLQIGFNSLNRVKAQITPELRSVVQQLPPRTFLYVNGKDNPIFEIPDYQYKGKPLQIFPYVFEQSVAVDGAKFSLKVCGSDMSFQVPMYRVTRYE
jgi:hypothetical protein